MLEINVSRLARDPMNGGTDPSRISCSNAERGETAGAWSWGNAMSAGGKPRPVVRRRQCGAVRDYFRGYGAWSDAELAAWSWAECCAIVLQHAAGDLRELQACCPGHGVGGVDWAEAERQAQAGRVSGNLFVSRGKLFISLSE